MFGAGLFATKLDRLPKTIEYGRGYQNPPLIPTTPHFRLPSQIPASPAFRGATHGPLAAPQPDNPCVRTGFEELDDILWKEAGTTELGYTKQPKYHSLSGVARRLRACCWSGNVRLFLSYPYLAAYR